MNTPLTALKPYLVLFGPYRWWLAGGLALSLLTLAGSLGLLGLSGGFLTATGIAGLVPDMALLFNVVIPAGGIRLFALVRTASRWSERVVNHEATFRLLGQLRVRLYDKFCRLSPRQLGLWHGAEILNRMTKDVDLLDNLYIRLLVPIGASALLLGGVFVLSWSFSPTLAIPAGVLTVVGVVFVPWVMYRAGFALSPQLVQRQEAVRRGLLDILEGLDDWILHQPSWEAQRTKVLDEDSRRIDTQVRIQRAGSAARAALAGTIGLAVWAMIGIVGTMPEGTGLDGPWFVALALVVLGTGEALLGLPAAWMELPGTASAARRLTELGDLTPDPGFPEGPGICSDTPENEFRLEDVSFFYLSDDPVLKGIDLTLRPGDHIALVGPSGGGKTTLVRLLTRLEDPVAGRLILGGRNLKEWDETSLRSMVSCAMQDPWIFRATLAENLRMASPEAGEPELWRVLDLVGLGDQVSAWPEGLETWVEEGGQSLSGGQRRRLALARALLRRTPITILDEPTEGLESDAAEVLVGAIRKELAGRTLVWVTHRRHGLDEFPSIWHLDDGRLSASDSPL